VTPGGAGKSALVTTFLAKHYGDNGQRPGSEMAEPVSTITASDHNALVSAGLMNLRGTAGNQLMPRAIETPVLTITAQGTHLAEVRAFLVKYHGTGGQHATPINPMPTIDSRDRIGVVTVHGIEYQIVDIGMRMLTPRERFNAQGFRPDYIIDLVVDKTLKNGRVVQRKISGDEQGRMVGNSISPVIPEALVRANFREQDATPPKASEEFKLEAAE